jgi:hypothetical protein
MTEKEPPGAGDDDAVEGTDEETTAEQTAVTQALAKPADGETAGTRAARAAAEPALAAQAPRRLRGRVHTVLIGILVLLSCLSVVATGIAWWAHYTTLNTEGYMRIVGPIGKDPAAIKSLSDYVSSQVVTALDLQARAESILPERAQFLAGPLTAQIEEFIQEQVYKLLSTEQAYQAWLKINEVAHDKIVGLLRGDNTYTYIAGSDVKLNVLPLVSQALVWLEGKLPGALQDQLAVPVIEAETPPDEAIQQVSAWAGKPLPDDFGQITLLENDSLGAAQTVIRVFDAMMWVLPVIVAVLVALTIWLSHRRRTTIIVLGIGVVVALVITHVIVKRATEYLVDSLSAGTAKTLVQDVITSSLGPLTTLTIWICVIGAVVAVVAWIIGRRDIQEFVVKAGKAGAGKADQVAKSDTPTLRWMRRNVALMRVIGLVVLLILLLVSASSWAWIITLLILLALYEVAVSYVAGEWPFQERAPHDTSE